ncbi:MAG: 30S ribosomal protein S9 [Elusimicrobiota bacterium]
MQDKSSNNTILRTGKRKCAIAKVWVTVEGEGRFLVNGKTLDGYFGNHTWQKVAAVTPLTVAKIDKADITAQVMGGGFSGQADAIKLGIARALATVDVKYKKLMRDNGLLTRDARIVERKKPGRPKARKRFQFSKR